MSLIGIGLIGNADHVYTQTIGATIASTTEWAGDNLIKLFIGSGLSLLYALSGWIVALVIIAAIVYFAYRAFRFYKWW